MVEAQEPRPPTPPTPTLPFSPTQDIHMGIEQLEVQEEEEEEDGPPPGWNIIPQLQTNTADENMDDDDEGPPPGWDFTLKREQLSGHENKGIQEERQPTGWQFVSLPGSERENDHQDIEEDGPPPGWPSMPPTKQNVMIEKKEINLCNEIGSHALPSPQIRVRSELETVEAKEIGIKLEKSSIDLLQPIVEYKQDNEGAQPGMDSILLPQPQVPSPMAPSPLQISGQMARLPFGRNPFAEPTPSAVANQPRPTASTLANQTRPSAPPVNTGEKQDKNKKRDHVDTSKNLQNKKQKGVSTEASPSESILSTFGSLAAENYSEEDLKILKGRKEADEDFHFKIGLGDAFFHGLNVLAHKNAAIKDLEKSNKKFKGEISTFNTKLGEVQKKAAEDVKASKDEVIKLQTAFDNFKLESKNAGEALEGENRKLREEIEGLKAGARKDLSEAYSTGFLDYLQNFLAADPEYDWSTHFAPSTPGYMLKFKSDNAEEIAAAKEELRQKIEAEMKAKADE